MELAKRIFLEIASASQRVISAATEYVTRRGFKKVQSCHFRLEKEMQRISVAAGGILDILSKSSLPNGPPLDDRLQDWLSTDEVPACLDTLHQMERMLQDDTRIKTTFNIVNTLRPLPAEDKIDAAFNLFDSRRNYFHFLLTTDVWNCEESQQQSRAFRAHTQDKPALELPKLEINDTSKVNQGKENVPFSTANRPTAVEKKVRTKMDDMKKLDDIIQWLDGLSCSEKQEETLSLRQPDTCTWLHSAPEYESWRNSVNSFLWLQGKPGSGKTVLASFVVDSLKNKRRNGEVLAFFYCDFRNDRSTSPAEAMRSLFSQFLRHIRNENIDPGELLDDLIREMDGDTPILKNIKHLTTFTSLAAKKFSHQPLIVVDALDECKDVEKLLDGLLTLTQGGTRLLVTSRPLQIIKDVICCFPSISMDKVTIAVSTDIALHVTRELDSRRRLRDLGLSFKTEIHSILCDRADGMFRWVQCQIDTLNQCATKAEVREALDNLPIGLDATYQRILVAIDTGSPEGKLALRALVWLVGALRPLRLVEILDGLAIDLGRRTMDHDAGPMHKGALLDACGSLVTYNEDTDILILSHFSVKEYLTGDLTRMKLPRYHISYQDAHEALARFCICYLTLYLKYLHKSDENTALLRIMRTIEGRSREWSHLSENSPAVFSMSLELLGYVFTDGFNHLAHLGSANRVVLNDMMALQMDIQRYPDAWEMIYQMSRDRKPPTPWPAEKHDFMFYVLIAFSSSSLFLAFLRRCHNVLKLRYQTNPLIYAAHFGKAHHAEMLLSRGAKVNERGLVIDASCQALPLEIAVARRNDSLVDLFLSAGSMVPKRLFTLSTYYNKFPVRIVRMLLETDQFVEWAVDPGNKLPSPLRILEQGPALAYEADIVFIIRKLVQVGVDHAEQDAAQRTALDFAILGGYRAVTVYLMLIGTPLGSSNFTSSARRITPSERASMVRLIVYAGVNVRVCGTGDTTLHLVIKFLEQEECLEAAKILVCAGCKPFVYNQARKTPLHLALEQEYSSVADYLLSQQRPASPDALSAVVESGCPTTWIMDTIRALINGGADIHGVTAYGDGLLHRAVMLLDENLGLEMAKLLVDAGCSPFEHSVQGKTPLHFALDRKSPLLADYLLSTAKLLPTPDDLFSILRSAFPAVWRAQTTGSLVGQGASASGLLADGSTLLHASVLSLNETDVMEVARLLVGAGCDPFKRNVQGKTAFDLVLDRKYSLLADYLLATAKLPPPDTLFAILRSAFPTVWRVQSIRSLVGKGVDVCGLSADGHTLLHATILIFDEGQALDVAQLLVGAGCDPFKSNAQGKTSLDLALDLCSSLLADYLLSTAKLTPPDALLSILRSALPAVWRAHTICSLIEQGADAFRLSTDGNTLLHTTVLSLDDLHGLGVAKLLVGAGYDPFKYNMQGRTPLHIALDRNLFLLADYLSLSTGRSPPPDVLFAILRSALPATWRAQTVSSLVYKGTDLRRPSADRHTLLHIIVLSLDERQALEVAKLLVGAGYNPFKRNLQGKTLLDLALDIKFHLLADLLLSTGRSPPSDVLFAVLCSKLPAVWKAQTICSLVGKGVDACGLSADGNTLLHITLLSLVEPHARQIAKILVGAGCDPSARNRQGKTALHIAAEKASFDVMDYMLSLDHSPLPDDILFSALKPCFQFHRHVDMLRILITKGANTRLVAVDGNTLLHAAISISWTFPILDMRTIVSKILVDGGCDAFAPNSRGNTPLHLAAANGCVSTVEYLLSIAISLPYFRLPANILTCVFDKDVPWTSWETMLQLLILKGANVHVRAADGGTLLHMAIKNVPRSTDGVNFLVIIQTLVVSGCDPSQCDADGHPPIYFAITNDHVQVVKYLLPRTVPLPRSLQDAANLAPEHVRGELTQVLEVQESVLPAKGKTSLARRITSRLRFR